MLCDAIFLVRLQGKFEVDHSGEWKGLVWFLFCPSPRQSQLLALSRRKFSGLKSNHIWNYRVPALCNTKPFVLCQVFQSEWWAEAPNVSGKLEYDVAFPSPWPINAVPHTMHLLLQLVSQRWHQLSWLVITCITRFDDYYKLWHNTCCHMLRAARNVAGTGRHFVGQHFVKGSLRWVVVLRCKLQWKLYRGIWPLILAICWNWPLV